MDLNYYLLMNGVTDLEGHSQQYKDQTKALINLVNLPHIKNVFEIGFNAGHSADIFLKSNQNITLTSCDINQRPCTLYGKQFIDKTYPNRHTLIIGDSTVVLPDYIPTVTTKYDLIFIDGGHSYDVAKADILNCKELAHSDTIVVVDDVSNYCINSSWAEGPTKVWNEMIENELIRQISHEDYAIGRGMAWGKYVFNNV
jgi:predicted O-methyltransferase YrrM